MKTIIVIALIIAGQKQTDTYAAEARRRDTSPSLHCLPVVSNGVPMRNLTAPHAERVDSCRFFNQVADAIRRQEGVWTYGVNVRVRNEAEARQVCMNTIRHAWLDWNGKVSFVDFLADRYCPPSCDPVGNRNWKRNVKIFLRH